MGIRSPAFSLLSVTSLAIFSSSAAASFAAPSRMQSVRMQEGAVAAVEPEAEPALPKIMTMRVGDKTLAGDMGFDPLQIADNSEKLAWYREAEVKHARLAMLAAFGWPVSEVLNFGKLLTNDGRAPSLLNGGLGEVNGVFWESKGLDKQFGKSSRGPDYLP